MTFRTAFGLCVILCLTAAGCSPAGAVGTATAAATAIPEAPASPTAAPTSVPLPSLTLPPGQFYFALDGTPGMVFSRNLGGYQEVHYDTFLEWCRAGGTRIARIQLDSLGMGYTSTGAVDTGWLAQWDRVFDYAEQQGVYVLPVFSGWFDWNAGQGYSTWKSNPLNAANGGPVKDPAELFEKDSLTQRLWLAWMRTLVEHWHGRRNIAAWEIFSEVNLASGPTEASGIDFVNQAAGIARAADPQNRPVTASLADTGLWPAFYRDAAIDFVNIHPYPPSGQLDRTLVSEVRKSLAKYQRPVLIGESGLNANTPDSEAGRATLADNARRGLRHAIWAGVVSGAMNGRALYWEDGFGIYFPELGMPWLSQYRELELAAAQFTQAVDLAGFQPVTASSSPGIWGAAIGNEHSIIGWYRDAGSEPPEWKLQPLLSGQTVTLSIPGPNAEWQIDFYDTQTGTRLLGSDTFSVRGGEATITLPDFADDIAFKMHLVK